MGRSLEVVTDRSGRASRSSDRVDNSESIGSRSSIGPPENQKKTYATATVQPLDVTGVRTVMVGTVLWLVAFVALLPFYSSLEDHDRAWWLWTCPAGFGLGLLGLEYCRRRRNRKARLPGEEVETSPLGAAGL